jgi:protein phosphatase 2C family protein 2/3
MSQEPLSPTKPAPKGRQRGGAVKFTSYQAYAKSGIGIKDERKETSLVRAKHGIVVSTCMKGWRKTMEDAHFVLGGVELGGIGPCDIMGVFDGHVNDITAKYCAEQFPNILREEMARHPTIPEALVSAYIRVDKEHQASSIPGPIGGSTAIIIVVTERQFIVANAGDCRAVLYKGGAGYTPLSTDHKPNDELESQRILAARCDVQNGRVMLSGTNSGLSVSRAIGDYAYKTADMPWELQPITCMPDVRVFERSAEDEFLVVACDGIWEDVPDAPPEKNKENFIGKVFRQIGTSDEALLRNESERILQELIASTASDDVRIGCDNMTLVGMFFRL